MSRLQLFAVALVIPLAFLGCSDKSETIIVMDPAPTIVSVTPNTIPSSGPVLLTITGTNFLAGAIVLLDNVPASAVTVLSDTLITASVDPPAGTGQVALVVRNPDGQEASTTVTYLGGPSVTSVSPYGGPLGGGTTVTITGTGFQTGAIVLIDSVPATGVTVASPTSITCTTPATASAVQLLAEILVQNPDSLTGNLLAAGAAVAEDRGFLYSPAPTVTSINPVNGPQAGSTSVTITGTGFHRTIANGGEADADATVTIGGAAATNVTVVNDTSITCDTPPHAAGDVDVVVTNPDAQAGTGVNLFHYNEFPDITSVTPNSVGLAGGTTVTIAGPAGATYFQNGATVTINGNPCTNYNYAGVPDSLDCDVPANPQGTYDVILTNPDSQSDLWGPTSTEPGVTYQPGPTVTAVVPNNGDIAGGYAVQVQGTGFDTSAAGVSVDFGTETTGPLTATSATIIDVPAGNMPASNGQIGPVNVRVTNIPTTLSGTLNNGFMYTDTANPPDITNVNPATGPLAGGTQITVTGTNFWNGTVIEINSSNGWVACTNYNYAGVPVTIVCDTPAGSGPGTWDVRAVNPDLTVELSAPAYETFLYVAAAGPTVTNVNPATGPIGTGTTVTVTGTGFYGVANGSPVEPTVDFIGTN
ncbi:MAG: IPT/TIG domain-containing protein, partial [Planctomycetota bacterium]